MSVKEMLEDHFTIDADDLPLDMFQQIDDPFPGCDVDIYFDADYEDEFISIDLAYFKDKQLTVSHKDAIELLGMIDVYRENVRQEMAESGA